VNEEIKEKKKNKQNVSDTGVGELLKPSSFLAALAKIRMFASVELIIELQLLQRRM